MASMAMFLMKKILTTIKKKKKSPAGPFLCFLEKARKDPKDILEGNTNDNLYCRY